MLDYLVVYASETGNTKKIADEIFYALPSDSKEETDIRNLNGRYDASTYFIGYWVNRGTCSLEVIDLITSLHGKNVAFFGTCGLGNDEEYYRLAEQIGTLWLSDDNFFLGSYFCQGSVSEQIRDRYEELAREKYDPRMEKILAILEEGRKHPDRQDLLKANVFTDTVIHRIPETNDYDKLKEVVL